MKNPIPTFENFSEGPFQSQKVLAKIAKKMNLSFKRGMLVFFVDGDGPDLYLTSRVPENKALGIYKSEFGDGEAEVLDIMIAVSQSALDKIESSSHDVSEIGLNDLTVVSDDEAAYFLIITNRELNRDEFLADHEEISPDRGWFVYVV